MNPQAMIDRRKFLAGLFIAPAIIASTNLMPVVASHRVVAPSIYTEAQLKQAILEAWQAGGSPDLMVVANSFELDVDTYESDFGFIKLRPSKNHPLLKDSAWYS